MKTYIIILSILFSSCSKALIEPRPEKPTQFTATLSINPNSKTLYYDVFVYSNREYAQKIKMVYPGEIKNGKYSWGFNLEKSVCNGIVTLDPAKEIKGHVQEWRGQYEMWAVSDNAIVIKRSKPLNK